ncbi:MAG: hypothetical protein WCJ30_08395 [Deltaproteobacteria bacterium]
MVRFLDRTLRREYHLRTETMLGRVRGRIDTAAWSANWMRGQPFAIPCEHFVFDIDTFPNQVLKAGLEAIERYLVTFCPNDRTRYLACRAAIARLRSVRSIHVRPDDLRSVRHDHMTSRYKPVHAICERVLKGTGLGHHGDIDGAPFVSFGFDLARAFQDLLLLLLRRVSSDDVRAEPRFSYRWIGNGAEGAARTHLKPDYVLARSREVLDAKYKDVLVGAATGGESYSHRRWSSSTARLVCHRTPHDSDQRRSASRIAVVAAEGQRSAACKSITEGRSG